MIKKYRPKSYKEDLHQIRFDLLEANSKVFERYVYINKWTYRLLENKKSLKLKKLTERKKPCKKKKLMNVPKENKKDTCKKRKLVNVHSMYQDRKKKHKKR